MAATGDRVEFGIAEVEMEWIPGKVETMKFA